MIAAGEREALLRRIDAALDALPRELHVGLRERMLVRRLLERRPALAEIEERRRLIVALVAMLARTKNDRQPVRAVLEARLLDETTTSSGDTPAGDRNEPPPEVREERRPIALAIFAAFAFLVATVVVVLAVREGAPPHDSLPDAGSSDAGDAGVLDAEVPTSSCSVVRVAEASTVSATSTLTASRAARRDPDALDLALVLPAFAALAFIGLRAGRRLADRLLRLEREDERDRELDVKCKHEYDRLSEEYRHARFKAPPPVSAFPPVMREALVESAGVLGGLFRPAPGDELDGDATAEATSRASGQWRPVMKPRRVPHPLTVLVGVEDDYVWLGAIRRLLAEWTRLGVPLDVHEFKLEPKMLTGVSDDTAVSIAELAQRAAGEPLLICARRLGAIDVFSGRESSWVPALARWPARAWIDPDPRPLASRHAALRREIELLESRKLVRFPLTEAGVVAAARYLVSRGQSPVRAAWPNLVLPEKIEPSLERALLRWAVLASRVPDASWDQLERARRRYPQIEQMLPARLHVQLLLDWVARKEEALETRDDSDDGEAVEPRAPGEGRTLFLSGSAVRAWIDRPEVEPEIKREWTEQLIEEQVAVALEAALELDKLRAELRIARLRTYLDPTAIAELRKRLAGPLRHVAKRYLREVLEHEPGGSDPLAPELRAEIAREIGRRAPRDAGSTRMDRARRFAAAVAAPVAAVLAPAMLLAALATRSVRDWMFSSPPPTAEAYVVPAIDEVVCGELRPQMVRIAPGRFLMGSPADEPGREDDETQHEVEITRAFAIGRTEVTQGQWTRVMGKNPSQLQAERGGSARHPVENVNWFDAVAYLNRLSEHEGLEPCYVLAECEGTPGVEAGFGCDRVETRAFETCRGYRLPTEAEWEYAARAGTRTAVYAGPFQILGTHNAPILDKIAVYGGNSGAERGVACGLLSEKQHPSERCATHGVASKLPNDWGLYDMIGNVYEWTNDWYAEDYGGLGPGVVKDPRGPGDGRRAVIRGCGFLDASRCRAAFRVGVATGTGFETGGFRPARSVP